MGESFSQLEERAKQATTIEELFCLWRKAHAAEVGEETFPCRRRRKGEKPEEPNDPDFKKSFCEDGVTSFGRKHSQNQTADVVFVLKEAHLEETSEVNCAAQLEKYFWFNQCDQNDKSYKGYAANLKKAMCALYGQVQDDVAFGYINLNKRGGFKKTNPRRLKSYVTMYEEFLKKQLELMKPQKIVFCGCYDGVAEKLFSLKKEEKRWNRKPVSANLNGRAVTLYYIYHPAHRGFKNSLDIFKKESN